MNKNAVKRMPRPNDSPQVSPRTISFLLGELKKWLADEAKVRAEYPWAKRFVMGLPLPWWQRQFKWDEQQSRAFITSAWTGIPLGMYVLTEDAIKSGNVIEYEPLTNCVMEGQQRLRALELYFTDQLAVPDIEGILVKWSELGRQEQLWFEHRIFDCGTIRERDEAKLVAFYNILNYGGTPHEENERAVLA